MSAQNWLLNALPLPEQSVGIPLLLCLVAQRNMVLYVAQNDDVHATQKLASNVRRGTPVRLLLTPARRRW